MPLYFAYGSNMSPKQMARRCPGSQPVGRAILEGWEYFSTLNGAANIRKRHGTKVHGVLWRCTATHIATLDQYEGISCNIYQKRFINIIRDDNKKQTAIIYIGTARYPGLAKPHYMRTAVISGAKAFDLPEAYIEELEGWLPYYEICATSKLYMGKRTVKLNKK